MLKARGPCKVPKVVLHQLNLCVPESEYDDEFVAFLKAVDERQLKYPIVPGGDRTLFAAAEYNSGGTDLIRNWPSAMSWSPFPSGPCFWAGNVLCVAPDGDVSICLLSMSRIGVIGNLLEEDLWPILMRARTWRRQLEENGRSFFKHCESCKMEEGNIRV